MVNVQVGNDLVKSLPVRKSEQNYHNLFENKSMPYTSRGQKLMGRGLESRELRKIVTKPRCDNSYKKSPLYNVIQPTISYNSNKCEMNFSYIGALDKHMLAHGGQTVGTYECPHCGVQYFIKNAVNMHMNENLMVVSMLCGINECNERFMARCEGSRHQIEEHGLQGKKIKLDNKKDNSMDVILNQQLELKSNPKMDNYAQPKSNPEIDNYAQPKSPLASNYQMSTALVEQTSTDATGTPIATVS